MKAFRIKGMKKTILNIAFITAVFISGCSSKQESSNEDSFIPEEGVIEHIENNTEEAEMKEILVTINTQAFTAILSDTDAANEFYDSLPITFTMNSLNGNEYYVDTENTFTADPAATSTINIGDIKLYNDDCIVLFYDTFQTDYSYTDIASITDTAGLAEALNSQETVTISFDQN